MAIDKRVNTKGRTLGLPFNLPPIFDDRKSIWIPKWIYEYQKRRLIMEFMEFEVNADLALNCYFSRLNPHIKMWRMLRFGKDIGQIRLGQIYRMVTGRNHIDMKVNIHITNITRFSSVQEAWRRIDPDKSEIQQFARRSEHEPVEVVSFEQVYPNSSTHL